MQLSSILILSIPQAQQQPLNGHGATNVIIAILLLNHSPLLRPGSRVDVTAAGTEKSPPGCPRPGAKGVMGKVGKVRVQQAAQRAG